MASDEQHSLSNMWAADVLISHPEPRTPDDPTFVTLGDGFAFSAYGFCHDLTEVDFEARFTPRIHPEGWSPNG